jgi:prephenate dehydrogenase
MPISLPVVSTDGASDAPGPFGRIGIVGLGLIGGSLALACRRRWPRGLVVGVDRNDVLEQAMVRHAIDVAADDLGMLAEVDLVVLCAPVEACIAMLPEVASLVQPGAVITDVGSTKRSVLAAASAHFADGPVFVGGHPFAGAARSGIEYGSPELFTGRPWFVVPGVPREGADDARARVEQWVSGLGGQPRVLDAEAHDRLMAALSHAPQLVASTLMHVVGRAAGAEGLSLAGRGLRDTTRLSSSPGEVWADVQTTNHDLLAPLLDEIIAHLTTLRDDASGDALRRLFVSAQGWRGALDASDRR